MLRGVVEDAPTDQTRAKDRAWYRVGRDPAGPVGDSGGGMVGFDDFPVAVAVGCRVALCSKSACQPATLGAMLGNLQSIKNRFSGVPSATRTGILTAERAGPR